MILLVDNYDSFVHNLARYVRELGEEALVVRNDALTVADMEAHSLDWCGTLSTRFRGVDLHEIPPNGQGIAALIALGILENTDIDKILSAMELRKPDLQLGGHS